jgi:hypothetical protein
LVWGVEDDFGFIAIEFDLSRDDDGFAFKGFDVWEFILNSSKRYSKDRIENIKMLKICFINNLLTLFSDSFQAWLF